MAFPYSKYQTVAQNHISRGIASNFYPKLPFLSAMGVMTVGNNNKSSLEIGRPSGEILSGKTISPAEKLNLGRINFYQPRIQRFETDNSKWMSERDTNPVVANASTNAQSEANLASAKFGWAECRTPILIWHETRDRALDGAGNKEGQGIAMSQLLDESTEVGFQEHIKEINDAIWNGNPTNQNADLLSSPIGLIQAFSSTNTYGNVDRAVETMWQAQVDATMTTVDIRAIIDDANLTKRCRILGNGIDLIVTTPTLWRRFKNQILTQSGLGQFKPDGVAGMAKMGVKQECLVVDNVYIIYDESCPASHVLCFTSNTWRIAFAPKKNMTVLPFVDISRQSEGAKLADQAFIVTRLMMSCDNPFINVKYSTIGT